MRRRQRSYVSILRMTKRPVPAFLGQRLGLHKMNSAQGGGPPGGQTVTTGGVASSPLAMKSFVGATVTVFVAGSATLATIYADNISTPLANPFTADANTGYWRLYAAPGRYDIQFSGGRK